MCECVAPLEWLRCGTLSGRTRHLFHHPPITASLLAVGYWLMRRWKRGPGSCREQEACRCKETAGSEKFSSKKAADSKEKVSEQEEKLKGADSGGSSLAVPTPSPMDTSKVRLDGAVSNLIQLGMSLLIARGQTGCLKVSSDPSPSLAL